MRRIARRFLQSVVQRLIPGARTEERVSAADLTDDQCAGWNVVIGTGGFPPGLWSLGVWTGFGGMSGIMETTTRYPWPGQERDPGERAEVSVPGGS